MEVKQIQWFDDHFYFIEWKENGQDRNDFIPSVTTKLGILPDRNLIRWRGEVGNEVADRKMNEAGDRGSRIHYAWYVMGLGGAVIYNPPMNPVYSKKELEKLEKNYEIVYVIQNQWEMLDVCKLKAWHKALNPEMIENEMTVYSLKNRDAGTLDKVIKVKAGKYLLGGSKPVELEDGLYVCDLKTGKSIGKAWMQLSAYAACYSEMKKEKITGAIVVHTGSTTRTGIRGLSTLVRTKEQLIEDYKDYRAIAEVFDRTSTLKPKLDEFESLITLK